MKPSSKLCALAVLALLWTSLLCPDLGAAIHRTRDAQPLRDDIALSWWDLPARSSRLLSQGRAAALALPENQARCLGPQNLLVLRVDFSDVPGEPISVAEAQRVLDEEVKPFIERNSFGQTTIVSTVSPKIYRISRSAQDYVYSDPGFFWPNTAAELFDEAKSLAKDDYALGDYSRIIVSYSSQLSRLFPNAKWNLNGLASAPGEAMWIGSFDFETVAHELCHTFGARHSDFWRGTATDPVAYGEIEEYGDPTDLMGHVSGRDHDLAPWHKYLCGWLPDEAIHTVVASGTYRVYRFDSPDADLTRPLALRVNRDNLRYYWIGLRGGMKSDEVRHPAGTADGAYVGLAFHENYNFSLLDLAPPYDDQAAVVLSAGATLDDSAAGVRIHVVERGGTGRDSYLDVQITLDKPVQPSLVGWGSSAGFEIPFRPIPPVQATKVATGIYHTLALRPDGTVSAVPGYPAPATTVPSGLADVVSLAAGNMVSGAIRSDGTFAIWGEGKFGLNSPPAGLERVRSIAFGARHAVALKLDGTVISWGERGNEFPSEPGAGDLPADTRNVVAIAAGDYLTLALRRDGSIVGAVPYPSELRRDVRDLTAIAAGGSFALGLRANGSLVILYNTSGNGHAEIPPGLDDIKQIAVSTTDCLALRADGTLVAWGGFGRGARPFHNLKLIPPPGMKFRSVATGLFHSAGASEAVESAIIGEAALRTAGKVRISWSASEGASCYLFDLSSLSTFASFTYGWDRYNVGKATSVELPALDPATTYYYRVHSVSATGETSFSNVGIIAPAAAVTISSPQNHASNAGTTAMLSVTAAAGSSCRWYRDGDVLADAVSSTLNLENLQPAATGLYVAEAINGAGQSVSEPAVVGVLSDRKVIGSGRELLPVDIPHPNGNIFDQVLLTGTAEAITADYFQNQITRTSFVDLDGDIVQVEFSGPGTLSIVLDNPSGPAVAEKYNQSSISYMKGHARIVIAGADEQTNVSIFTVGRTTAVNQSLFKDTANYDGIADIAYIAISSPTGRFGGIRAANAQFFAAKGFTGVYAPGVQFTGPVYLGDISAYDTAHPMIVLGASASEVRITGGDMLQDNGQPVRVSGVRQLRFTPGSDSHGNSLPARPNDAIYQEGGVDVTAQIVVNP
ncbi:hypothetical protein [Opitutus terrae]|nr:hypothetical protein [Opitutus terrae]